MKALIFIEPGKLEIAEKKLRKPNNNELIIKINSCGVCGTDFHIFKGDSFAECNTILGHEFSGIIVDKNNHIEFENGDKVVIDPNIYCGKCSYCRNGKINFCKNHKALGVTLDGGFAEYAIVPITQVYKIPSDISLDIASFAEPLSCCLRGIDRAEIKIGESVAILGGGTIGLMMLQLARLCGAAKLILIEPIEFKQQLAYKFGADLVLSPFEPNLNEIINDITNGGVDCVIECVGKPEAVSQCFDIVKRGGKIVLFGVHPINSRIEIDLNKAFLYELSIRTSYLNPNTFSQAIELLINQKIHVESFPVEKISLETLLNVFDLKTKIDTIKYQFHN